MSYKFNLAPQLNAMKVVPDVIMDINNPLAFMEQEQEKGDADEI